MIWQSWGDFFAMGGYGLYVWGSTAATFVLLVGEIIALRLRRTAALKALGKQFRATQAKQTERQHESQA